MGGSMLSSVPVLRSLVAALIALAVLAGPAAAFCFDCCAPAAGIDTSITGASCCGCQEAMAPAAPSASDSLAAARPSAAAAPAGVPVFAVELRVPAPAWTGHSVSPAALAARIAPTPQRL